jgi:hypothetical protein
MPMENTVPTPQKTPRQRRTQKGITFMIVGALLGFNSCLFTLCNPINWLYDINLYGGVTLAVGLAIYGLYLLIEN